MWRCATDWSWALHCEHIRAGRHIVLHGPDPREIYPPSSWEEIQEALCWELEFVREHLLKHPDYCVLNLCRLVYSFQTRDVVISKALAADWAYHALPGWREQIDRALRSYAGQSTAEDRALMLSAVEALYSAAVGRIAAAPR